MLEFLRTVFATPDAAGATPRDPREAVAALMVEAARADADYDDGERAVIERFLGHMFALPPAEARAAREAGEAAQAESSDLHRFTKVIKERLSPEERMTLLEALWTVVFSDGERDPHEDALMRKLAPLIAVTDRESAEARRRVAPG